MTTKSAFLRPPIVSAYSIDEIAPDSIQRVRVSMTENATGNETLVPVMVMRGEEPGPVVGVTAAIHGNELNGIIVVHRLFEELGKQRLLKGAVVGVPLLNVPGYLRQQRQFEDGVDLNRIMPGSPTGNESALYAHRILERIIAPFDYLVDLHTASTGRENSHYVRADMTDARTAELARILSPQLILHSPNVDGTLRGAAQAMGKCALTVEVGDPQRLQRGLVRSARLGLQEMLEHLGMLPDISDPDPGEPVECSRSLWMHTDRGGVLRVSPQVTDEVKKGDRVATLRNIWGDLVREYMAPEDGVVIGRSINPAARAGSRIIHLGIRGTP